MKTFKQNKGITLIALVVTIIVLLILASIALNLTIGENGIFSRAQIAASTWRNAEANEQNAMDKSSELIDTYLPIDWNTVLANAQKHPDQETSTAIGVGTDGKAVNMDLWHYTLLDNGTYALNTSESIDATGTREAGYIGNIINGEIEGRIPQYIKNENDANFIEVSSLPWTFYKKTDLINIPILPSTVTNMYNTFNGCSNLVSVENIPNSIINMQGAFNGCENLKIVKDLPNQVENMSWAFQNCINLTSIVNLPNNLKNIAGTFYGCKQLTTIEKIPYGVTNMQSTFSNCQNLTTVGTIPNSVINMCNTFSGCTNLQGEIVINANLTGSIIDENNNMDYSGTLLNACTGKGITLKISGTCSLLKEMISVANNSNIILAE